MAFTIHDIDPTLDERLTERARREGISKNKLVKNILAHAVGITPSDSKNDEYRKFLGMWTDEEKERFDSTQDSNRTVNPEDWH